MEFIKNLITNPEVVKPAADFIERSFGLEDYASVDGSNEMFARSLEEAEERFFIFLVNASNTNALALAGLALASLLGLAGLATLLYFLLNDKDDKGYGHSGYGHSSYGYGGQSGGYDHHRRRRDAGLTEDELTGTAAMLLENLERMQELLEASKETEVDVQTCGPFAMCQAVRRVRKNNGKADHKADDELVKMFYDTNALLSKSAELKSSDARLGLLRNILDGGKVGQKAGTCEQFNVNNVCKQ